MRIGVLTSGGDCPGLNAVLRALARRAESGGQVELVGFRDAWRGVLEGDYEPLTVERCRGILPRGGTILGTSRVQPYAYDGGLDTVKRVMAGLELEGFVVIGGEGSLACAHRLNGDGVPCVGVPKTIDNDVAGTELTFGFDTAVAIATEAIDRLQTTSEAHERVMVIEVMGRHAGHIAFHSGIAGGAAAILIPEVAFDLEELTAAIMRRRARGVLGTVVVVAEGAQPVAGTMELPEAAIDEFGHIRLGGIGDHVAGAIERITGIEARCTALGYTQRGGSPSAFDRMLCTRFGVASLEAVEQHRWGTMVALRGGDIVSIDLSEAAGKMKLVDLAEFDEVARPFVS